MTKKRKYPKLTRRERELASRYVREERREKKPGKKTRKYKPKQAIAIGIARAKRQAKLEAIRKRHRL